MKDSAPIFPHTVALIVLVFMTFVPSLGHFFSPKGNISNIENRYLKSLPNKVTGITDFTEQMDDYLNDHFGFRQPAIKIERKIKRIWGDGETSVYSGIEGWLFLSESRIWDSYLGQSNFTKHHLDSLSDLISLLSSTSNSNGVAFVATIVPNKASVYSEFAPIRFGEKSPRNFYDYFVKNLDMNSLNFIDIKPKLKSLKSQDRVYFKTDTHWTMRGAYQGYRALVDYLKIQKPDLSIFYEQDIEKEYLQKFSGDLSVLDGRGISEEVLDIAAPAIEGFDIRVLAESVLHEEWKTIIYERPMKTGRSIVVIGDSFSKYYLSFLKRDFDKIIFVHHQLGEFNIDGIFNYDPDFIIFSPVERYMESIAVNWESKQIKKPLN